MMPKTTMPKTTTKQFMNARAAFIAIGSVAIATVVRTLINVFLHEEIPYSTFYPAVMLTALCCGFRWGVFSVLLSAVSASFWLAPTGRPLITEVTDLAGMALFLVVCMLIVWLAARVAASRNEAEQSAEQRQELLLREQAARKEAERANRAKDDILAAVSHELRNPLQSIVGWVQLLRRQRLSPEETKLALESIERSSKVQTQLVDDLMELSRIRMGRLRIETQPVCLTEIVRSAIQAVVPTAEAKGIQLAVPNGPLVGPVLADPERIYQVVWNLLSNAIKFTPSGGEVRVVVTDHGTEAEVRVIDTGEGIEASFLPLVFDRFQQAARGHRGGLGLGLSITKELVELHGGAIEVSSRGKGMGAEFKFWLPKLRVRAVVKKPASDSAIDGDSKSHAAVARNLTGKRILVVDDDAEARLLVAGVLKAAGAATVLASSAAEAHERLKTCEADVLVSDLGMPEVDGLTLIERVRRQERGAAGIPAVALSAYTRESDRSRAIESGFQMHLGKPVEPRELVEAVASLAGTL